MASYEELKKRYSEGPSYHEKFRQQYGGPIKEQSEPVEERPSAAVRVDKAIENAISRLLPKATTIDGEKPKRDAAAYEQAKKEAREKKAMKGYAEKKEKDAADKATYDAGVKEIEALSAYERQQLQNYVAERNNAQVNNLLSGVFGTGPQFDNYNLNPIVQKYGIGKVRKMAETYERMQNEQLVQDVAEGTAQALEGKAGIGHNVASIGANAVGGIVSTIGRGQELMNRTGQYQTLQEHTAGDALNVYAGTVREETAKKIEGDEYDEEGNLVKEGGALRKGLSIGYQGVMSAADSIARAALGGGGAGTLALAATGSFSQTVGEASKQGASPTQAIILGVGTAAIEAATEKVPLDNLLKAAKGGVKGLEAIAGNALRQAAIEAGEEEISLFANLLWEAAVLREKSSYKQRIGEAIANGATYEEAKAQADKEVWQEALNTAAVSASAGIFSGATSATYGILFGSDEQGDVQTEHATEAVPEAPVQQQQEHATQEQSQPDVAQAAAQELTQAQQAEAEAQAAQAQAQEAIAQGMAEQYGPMMPQAEPKSQLQQDIDNATAATLAENGVAQPEEMSKNGQKETASSLSGDAEASRFTSDNATKINAVPNDSIPENRVEIKGTGAAEQNFSGKAQYQDLLYEGNVQPDREGDVRPMEVPKTDPYDRNVSEFAANAYGAEVTPDSMASTIEELVQEGALGFDRKSNQSALNDAAKVIENSSPSAITRRITTNIANGKIKDGDIEQAMLLYSHYANKNGERAQAQAAELMVDLTTMAHMTGRNLQLFKLLRKLTPEGQVMTVKRIVEQNVESMIRSGKASKDSKVEINEQLLEDYKKAAAENARAVSAEQKAESEARMQEIQQAIMADAASQIKSTFKAKWDAWRYMAMLGNGKTQIINIAGNALFMPYKAVKDTIGAAFEVALPKEQRTKALTTDLKLLSWARQDSKTEAVHDALKYTGKLGDDAKSAKFSENVRVFDSNILESARKMVEKAPQGADVFFKDRYYATSLAGFLRARGYNLNDIQSGKVSEAVMAEARGYAINEAMKATFNDCNAFSDAVSSIGRNNTDNPWGKVMNYAGESLLPFRRTPANILVRFAEYSPAGMVKGAWDMANDVASGKLSAASAVDQIASGLTGTGALMLGYFLAKGIGGVKLTGSGADEDEKRQGHQDYALEFSIGGQEYSYKIDWAAPANLPLFVGANLYEALASKDADTSISTFSRILQTAKGAVEPLLQLSCMSSLNDFVEGILYAPEDEGIYTAVADIATSYFTQGIPALLRQASQAIPANKQTTFANDADPNIRELQKLGAQIPIVGSEFQMDKRNAWGETETTADPVMRAVNAFLNPGTLKKIDNSELEQEISRLNETQEQNVTPPDIPKKLNYTDASGVYHDGYRLTEEQYQKIAETQGQTAKTILDKLTGNADYKKLTDEQKAFTFQAVYQYAQEKGKQAAIPDYHSNADAWIADMRDFDMRGFIAQGSKKALNNAIGNAIASGKNGWQVTEATKGNMEQAYDSFRNLSKGQQKRILDEVSSDTLKYIEARKAGATTQNYLDITRNVDNLGSNAKAADKYAAVAKTTGISDSAKDAMVKAYMTDYDPNAKSPNTIELKYDYAREELGLTAEEFAQVYRISAEDGKKDEKYEKWKKQGYSPAECDALWALFEASGKKKTDVVAWHNSK